MDEPPALLERLHRIERLDRDGARPDELLAELRALVEEAVESSRTDPRKEVASGGEPPGTVT